MTPLEGDELPTSSTIHIKQLKSTLSDLQRLFSDRVTARHIAEPFIAFDAPTSAVDARRFMAKRGFDILGVRSLGAVSGYANRDDLNSGTLGDYCHTFQPAELVDEDASINTVLKRLVQHPAVCVRVMGQIMGIITRGDLQKIPVRMWLFGLLSLIEMQFLRLIRAHYPNDNWIQLVSAGAERKARNEFERRCERNEEIDLADCLDFNGKISIIAATASVRTKLGYATAKQARGKLKEFREMRNDLAHQRDIVTHHWPDLVRVAAHAEDILHVSETLD